MSEKDEVEVGSKEEDEYSEPDHLAEAQAAIEIYKSLLEIKEQEDTAMWTKQTQKRFDDMKPMLIRIAYEHLDCRYTEMFGAKQKPPKPET